MSRAKQTLMQRILGGIAVAAICRPGGNLMSKVLIFVLQLMFMASMTFYAAINASTTGTGGISEPAGGIMVLLGLGIAAGWVILLIVLQIVHDLNVVIAGKIPLVLIIVIALLVCFVAVLIAGIAAADDIAEGGGDLIGYFILTWVFTEILVAVSVFVQFKLSPRDNFAGHGQDDEDEFADNRGTFSGVDPSVAGADKEQGLLAEGSTDDVFTEKADQPAGDDDLGLL